jgi:two-component system, chemotaxis family, chemotaxis protein CheY
MMSDPMIVWPPALIVDDFRTMTRVIADMLHQIGFTDVDCAFDGPSALKQLQTKNYGLVLSGWEMHPMNGPQLIRAMRRDAATSNIPVILVTGKFDQDRSWLAGGDGYIVKPFTIQTLHEKVEEVLSRQQTVIPQEDSADSARMNEMG